MRIRDFDMCGLDLKNGRESAENTGEYQASAKGFPGGDSPAVFEDVGSGESKGRPCRRGAGGLPGEKNKGGPEETPTKPK